MFTTFLNFNILIYLLIKGYGKKTGTFHYRYENVQLILNPKLIVRGKGQAECYIVMPCQFFLNSQSFVLFNKSKNRKLMSNTPIYSNIFWWQTHCYLYYWMCGICLLPPINQKLTHQACFLIADRIRILHSQWKKVHTSKPRNSILEKE